jgi:hypothetical protein
MHTLVFMMKLLSTLPTREFRAEVILNDVAFPHFIPHPRLPGFVGACAQRRHLNLPCVTLTHLSQSHSYHCNPCPKQWPTKY